MVIFQYNLYILGSIFELCYIQNCVIMNRVIRRLKCNISEKNNSIFYGVNTQMSVILALPLTKQGNDSFICRKNPHTQFNRCGWLKNSQKYPVVQKLNKGAENMSGFFHLL